MSTVINEHDHSHSMVQGGQPPCANDEMSRAAWLAERKQGVGASEAAALFGVHPYISQLSLYESKISDVIDKEGNERMEDGKVIEPRIAARWEKATGRKARRPQQQIYFSPECPRMFCSPDFLFDVDGKPLETKWWDNFREGDEIPEYGQIQNQQQMACLAVDSGALAILGSFRSFHHFDTEIHKTFIEVLCEKIEKFWWHVENRVPPSADGSDATRQALRRLYPRDSGATVFLPAEAAMWVNDMEAARVEAKAAEARIDFAKNQIVAAIGDATFGELPDGRRYSYKFQKRAEHVVKASEFRVLRASK